MKVLITLVALVLVPFSVANSFFDKDQAPLADDGGPVPGDNPLHYCTKDKGILDLDYVNLDPNPPVKASNLTIEASGTLAEDVEDGAYVFLTVFYWNIKILESKTDLCEQVSKVDLECPLKAGKTTITKEVALPDQIPPGSYKVHANAFTVDEKPIICLEAQVSFPK